MKSKIRVLSEQTINQIAAGEVIENPASVVKEIVENAIDANSTEITVEIVEGGRNLIRITDNGYGMNADDALLCLERHATSKIKNVDDIATIMTMGFRGEAIPSIASISKFSILTCAEGEETGTLVTVDGGKILQCTKAARSYGTTMEIKSLFFNVPVRRKFQKSPNIDTNEILKILTILAIGNPSIRFELISNEKKLFSTPLSQHATLKERLKTRINSLLGSDFAESITEVEGNVDGLKITGFIGFPSVTRQNRTGQYLYINQRAIHNFPLFYAIREAYGTAIPTNRHPIFVLHLTIPGDLIDVNVHPQKREVRLRQDQSLKELITKSIVQALQNESFTTNEPDTHSFTFAKYPVNPPQFSLVNRYKTALEEAKDEDLIASGPYSFNEKPLASISQNNQPEFFLNPDSYKTVNVLGTIPGFILVDPNSLTEYENKMDVSLCLSDQKRATSRIIFERLCENRVGAIQPLLIPYIFETTIFEEALILGQLDFFNQIGLKVHQTGLKSFSVDSIPYYLKSHEIKTLLIDLAEHLTKHEEDFSLQNEKEKLLATLASRYSLSENKRLSLDEAKELLNQLMKCKMPYSCPKGQPIFGAISRDELKKFF